MNFWPSRARLSGILVSVWLGILVLTGCQKATMVPTVSIVATPREGRPTGMVTPLLTVAPTVVSTPTVPPVDLGGLRGKEITLWHPWQGGLSNEMDQAIDSFNQSNEWGIKVQVKAFYNTGALSDAVESLATDSEGTKPQVIVATSEQLADWYVNGKSLLDLTDYVTSAQYGLSEGERNAYSPVFWNQDVAEGHRFGMPALRNAQILFYNSSWAKELGFSNPPTTPDEFKQQACEAGKVNNAATEISFHGTGGWLIDSDALTTMSWLAAFGANPVPDGEGKPYTFESEQSEQAISFTRQLYDNGCAWVGRNPEPYEYFSKRMALFYAGNLTDISSQKRIMDLQQSKDEWTILPFPGSDGKPVVYSGGYSYGLLQSEDKEAALAGWLLIRWLETPRVAAKLTVALPSIPVSSAIASELGDYQAHFPWDGILPLFDQAKPAPALSSWRQVRRLVEDATWQIFHLPVEGLEQVLPQTLPQLDQSIQEIVQSPK